MYEPFNAVAEGQMSSYTVEVISIKQITETHMCICTEEGPIHITKEQAMKFFGLIDPATIPEDLYREHTSRLAQSGFK